MAGNLGEAFVEVSLRDTGFAAQVERSIEGPLKEVARTGERSAEEVDAALKSIGEGAFTRMQAAAEQAGVALESSFVEASAAAGEALDTVTDPTQFARLTGMIEATTAEIEAGFITAAEASDAALGTIGGSSLVDVAVEGETTGVQVGEAFVAAAEVSNAAVDSIGRNAAGQFTKIGAEAEAAGVAIKTGIGKGAAEGAAAAEAGAARSGRGFKGLIGPVTGAAVAVGAIGFAIKKFVDAGGESARVARLTEAGIKATGGAAGVTADHVGSLADQLSQLSGMDDEAIQHGENLLLTFTGIKNAAGEGNDIFDQTSLAMVNMAAVMGTDASGAALQLGKALNDPTQGMTALQRAGVSFTDEQKAQVKAMQESGDLLGAQKLILGELGKEFGGAAEAARGPLDNLTVSAGNVAEAIGQQIMPLLAPVAAGLGAFLDRNREGIARGIGSAISGVASAIGTVASFIRDSVIPAIANFATAVGNAWTNTQPLRDGLGDLASTILGPIVTQFGSLFTLLSTNEAVVHSVAAGFASFAASLALLKAGSSIASSVSGLVGPLVALGPVALIIAGVVAAVVAIGVAAFEAYQHFKPFRDAVDSVARFLQDKALPAIEDFGSALADFGGGAIDTIAQTFSDIGTTVADSFGTAQDAVDTAMSAIETAIVPVLTAIQSAWAKYGDEVTGILTGFRDIAVAVFDFVAADITGMANVVSTVAGPAFNALLAVAQPILDNLRLIVETSMIAIETAIQAFFDLMIPIWTASWGLLTGVVENVIGPIGDLIEGLLQIIQGMVDVVAGLFTGDWGRIWTGVQEIVGGAVNAVTGLLNTLLGFLQGVWQGALEFITAPIRGAAAALSTIVSGAVSTFQAQLGQALGYVSGAWSAITNNIVSPVANAVGQVGSKIGEIVSKFAELPGKAGSAIASLGTSLSEKVNSAATSVVGAVGSLISQAAGKISELPGALARAVGNIGAGIASAIGNAIRGAVNAAIDAINDHLPSIDTPFGSIGVPHLHHVAIGGIFTRATPVLLGEAGAEAVIPLTNLPRARQLLQETGLDELGQTNGGTSVNFNGPITFGADPQATVAELEWMVKYRMRTVA